MVRGSNMPRYGPGIKYAKIWSEDQICQDMVRGSNMPRYGPGIKYTIPNPSNQRTYVQSRVSQKNLIFI